MKKKNEKFSWERLSQAMFADIFVRKQFIYRISADFI